MKDYLVGIDVASSKVCAALGKRLDDGNFQVIEVASVKCNALSKALVKDIGATTEAVKKCIDKLQRKPEIPLKNVVLNFPGGLCDLFHTSGAIELDVRNKKITAEDVAELLDATRLSFNSTKKEIIGIIPKGYIIDNKTNTVNPIGLIGNRLEVDAYVVGCEIRPIFDILLSLEHAGIVPEEIMIQPVALASLLQKNELYGCSVLLNIGADTTDLCVYKEGNICYTRLIPLGGSNITSDISKCLKISYEEAESIKINFGDMDYKSKEEQYKNDKIPITSQDKNMKFIDRFTLNQIIFARVEEILKFILDELKTSSYYDNIEVIVVSGGGLSLFNNMNKLIEDLLNKRVRIIPQEMDRSTNSSNTTVISVVKNKIDSYNFDNILVKSEETKVEKDSKKTKNKKFGWRITEFLEEFF